MFFEIRKIFYLERQAHPIVRVMSIYYFTDDIIFLRSRMRLVASRVPS